MINNVTLAGRLAADIDVRHTQSGITVGNFTLAVSRPKMKDRDEVTDWIECTLWRCENIQQYLTKGKPIAVTGELHTQSWEDQNGNKRKSMKVNVGRVSFLPDSKCGSGQAAKPQSNDDDWTETPFSEDDLPF